MGVAIFWAELVQTFVKFLYAPIIFPELLWITLPLIAAILLMESYFSRYSRESLGHHKSLENTIFLLFISFDLVRYAITEQVPPVKIGLTIMVILFFAAVAVLDFMHRLPLNLPHKISSKLVIGFVSYAMIVLMYSDLLESLVPYHVLSVMISVVLAFGLVVFVRKMITFLEPKSYEEIEHFLKKIEDDLKKSAEQEASERRQPAKDMKKKNQPR